MKQVAMVGTARNTARMTPWQDETWDVWSLGSAITVEALKDKLYAHADLLFEIHKKYEWEKYQGALKKFERPILMQQQYVDEGHFPNAIPYPRDEVRERWNKYFPNEKVFATCSVPWMIAYAMLQGYDHIGMFGLDFLTNDEYLFERPSICWWIGFAQAKGIEFTIPEASGLISATAEYGFEGKPKEMLEIQDRIAGLRMGIEQLEEKREALDRDIARHKGAVEDCEYFLRRFSV
jgi:hypothetical protein